MAAETAASAAPGGPAGRTPATGGGLPPPPDTGAAGGDVPAPPAPRDPPDPLCDRPFGATSLGAMTGCTPPCRPGGSTATPHWCPATGGISVTTRPAGTIAAMRGATPPLPAAVWEFERLVFEGKTVEDSPAAQQALLAALIALNAKITEVHAGLKEVHTGLTAFGEARQAEAERTRTTTPNEPVRVTAHDERRMTTGTASPLAAHTGTCAERRTIGGNAPALPTSTGGEATRWTNRGTVGPALGGAATPTSTGTTTARGIEVGTTPPLPKSTETTATTPEPIAACCSPGDTTPRSHVMGGVDAWSNLAGTRADEATIPASVGEFERFAAEAVSVLPSKTGVRTAWDEPTREFEELVARVAPDPSATVRGARTAPSARAPIIPCGGPLPPPGTGAPSGGILPPPAPRGPPDPARVARCSASSCSPVAASLTPGAKDCTGIARGTARGAVPPRPASTGASAEHKTTGGNTLPLRWTAATGRTIGGGARGLLCSTGPDTTRRTIGGTAGPPASFPGTNAVRRTLGRDAGKRIRDAGLTGEVPPTITRVAPDPGGAAYRYPGRARFWPHAAPDPGSPSHRHSGRVPFRPVATNHASGERNGGRLAPAWVPHQPRACRVIVPDDGCGRRARCHADEEEYWYRRVRYVHPAPDDFQSGNGRDTADSWSHGSAGDQNDADHDYSSCSSKYFWDDSSSCESDGFSDDGVSYWSS